MKTHQPQDIMGWYCRYHIRSDRMLNVRALPAGGNNFFYIDQEFNIYKISEFYPWKITE